MARWGRMTERGTYTMPPELKEKLGELAYATDISESKLVRNALDLYFEQIEKNLVPLPSKEDD